MGKVKKNGSGIFILATGVITLVLFFVAWITELRVDFLKNRDIQNAIFLNAMTLYEIEAATLFTVITFISLVWIMIKSAHGTDRFYKALWIIIFSGTTILCMILAVVIAPEKMLIFSLIAAIAGTLGLTAVIAVKEKR